MQQAQQAGERFQINTLNTYNPLSNLVDDVRSGLDGSNKSLPPKYFYDERGSQLFDLICQTPEYYLTRAEAALLDTHASDIVTISRPKAIIEFGSGTAEKTETLIDAAGRLMGALHYLPFDVCEEMLIEACQRLIGHYPWLHIDAWHGDFTNDLSAFTHDHDSVLYTFLGSSIGNFTTEQAIEFLSDIHRIMDQDDYLLLGADMVKDNAILNAAYNDSAGHTAAFNLNLLNVLNRELDGDFRPDRFHHHARFDEQAARIEMHLVSDVLQQVNLRALDMDISFEAGEHILTEYSHKYTPASIDAMLATAGFQPARHFTDADGSFMLVLAGIASVSPSPSEQ